MTSLPDPLAEIYQLQSALQIRMGMHPATMTEDQCVEYVRMNVLALTDELHEALNEVNWKPWAKASGFRDIDKFAGELSDALHFLMNLYLAAGVTPEEILALYKNKNARNHERQDHGYTGLDKCDRCHRELDDPVALPRQVRRDRETLTFCSAVCMEQFMMEEEGDE